MSGKTPPSPPNVTTLASRAIKPRFNELTQSCRKLVLNHLAEHFNQIFLQVDDALFERAEKAENNAEQTFFFDGMREVRKLRPLIERHYQQKIAQHFADFIEAKAPAHTAHAIDADKLSLVQTDDFEESLCITTMVTRLKGRCPELLYGLEQRMALLNNGQKLGDQNPFGPQVIAQSFCDALKETTLSLPLKAILYQLFDQHVMNSLDQLYQALNQQLIDAGVLPNLKQAPQRSAQSPRSTTPAATTATSHSPLPTNEPSPSANTGGASASSRASTGNGSDENSGAQYTSNLAPDTPQPPQGPLDLSAPPPNDTGALLQGLNHLLREHRQRHPRDQLPGNSRSISSFAPEQASQTYSASELQQALDRLQQHSAQALGQQLSTAQSVDELKANLQSELKSHSANAHDSKVAEPEADVIDLVGMLFDFILNDENLPPAYKTALSHLHTPYLKVALEDKALFTQHTHPARRLLNTMAQAGVLYDDAADESYLRAKIHGIIERVLKDFSGDVSLFETLLTEFNTYVDTLRHKVELRERRAVEAAKGRDRLLSARQKAITVIHKSLANRQPPAILRNFLELTWTDVLVFVLLRHGSNSPEWQRSCEVAEQLAWSGEPQDAAGRQQLQTLRVTLLSDLRKGLELLGSYHEDGIRRLLQDLVACQHAVQAKQPHLAEKLNASLPDSPLGVMLGEDAELAQPSIAPTDLSARSRAICKELSSLTFGTWFEFTHNGQSQVLKLSWFSPTTHNYMFVDNHGKRVAMKPLTVLANEIEHGQARIIQPEHSTPMVDKALNAIYRVLQRFTGRATDPTRGA